MLLGVEGLRCSVLGSNLLLWGEIWDPVPTAKDAMEERAASLRGAVRCFALVGNQGDTPVLHAGFTL